MDPTFRMTWLAVILVVMGCLFGVALPIRLLARSGRESIPAAILLTIGICGGLFLLTVVRTGVQTTEVVQEEPVGYEAEQQVPPPTAAAKPAAASAALMPSAEFQSSPDGNVMWLPLSSEVLKELISEDGVAAIARLNESLPPELRQAYAMIPISAPSPAAGPVVETALSAPVVRDALASSQVQTAIARFVDLALNYHSEQRPAERPARVVLADDFEMPEWVDHPGIGQIVLESPFEKSTVSAIDALRPTLTKALLAHVDQLGRGSIHTDGGWRDMVQIHLSDDAMSACIRETATRREVVTTLGTQELMHKTYALVEFPPEVERQAVAAMRETLQHDRAIAVCAAVASLWVGWMLVGMLFRTNTHSSRLRRLAAAPLLGLLVIPCVLVTGMLVASMINGETFGFQISDDPVICSVGVDEAHPAPVSTLSGP